MKKQKALLGKKSLCLAGAALCLAGSVTVGSAIAYFTTYATASGTAEVSLGFTETEPEENFVNGAKHILIKNTGPSDCFVRVRILYGEQYEPYIHIDGKNWEERQETGEGGEEIRYFYYKNLLPAGEKMAEEDELLAQINVREIQNTDDFNVIVIQECTPVLYDEQGNSYADWNVILDTRQDSYN